MVFTNNDIILFIHSNINIEKYTRLEEREMLEKNPLHPTAHWTETKNTQIHNTSKRTYHKNTNMAKKDQQGQEESQLWYSNHNVIFGR